MESKFFRKPAGAYTNQTAEPGTFKEFDATELYCPMCKRAVPVRKHLLIVLPEGDKYEYRCVFCSQSVGTKMDKKPIMIIS